MRLVNACNQKSSREPVMELSEAEVRTALFELDQLGLVRTIAESRATKFEHRVRDVLNLRRDEVAVMCLLLLRGAQTSAELRARTERMYAFDDNAAVLSVLERLAAREEPLTQLMARQAGGARGSVGALVERGWWMRAVARAWKPMSQKRDLGHPGWCARLGGAGGGAGGGGARVGGEAPGG